MKKQISLVLEIDEMIDELDVIREIKKFFKGIKVVQLVGTHVKLIKENERHY